MAGALLMWHTGLIGDTIQEQCDFYSAYFMVLPYLSYALHGFKTCLAPYPLSDQLIPIGIVHLDPHIS